MNRISVLLFAFVVLTACGSKSKVSKLHKEPKPAWVESLPYNSSYYQGVGMVKKIGFAQNYKSEAQKNALSMMAGQVNANISSTSILHQVEDRSGVSEILINSIRSQSEEMLEGYELMGSWEDEVNYYEYYRLSKSKFAQVKEQRKQDALKKAVAHYDDGMRYLGENKSIQAFQSFTRVLDVMALYLGDNTVVGDSLSAFDPVKESMRSLSAVVAQLTISSVSPSVSFSKSASNGVLQLPFTVQNSAGIRQNDVPVRFSFTGGYLRVDVAVSKDGGEVKGLIHQLPAAGKFGFCGQVDVNRMVQQATPNLLVRKLLGHLAGNSGCVSVVVD
jgi:hypothetical protein